MIARGQAGGKEIFVHDIVCYGHCLSVDEGVYCPHPKTREICIRYLVPRQRYLVPPGTGSPGCSRWIGCRPPSGRNACRAGKTQKKEKKTQKRDPDT